ncbi:hypothetical protein, partial [Miniimonas arenae]|uniref:hypothetical protein n=1 Tax=Miniimonas arenae TaxID=676201 RepID=UPI001C57CD37
MSGDLQRCRRGGRRRVDHVELPRTRGKEEVVDQRSVSGESLSANACWSRSEVFLTHGRDEAGEGLGEASRRERSSHLV